MSGMLIGLLVFGLIALGAFGWFGIAMLGKVERDQNKAEKNADQILDEAFDGRADVVFPLNMRTLKPETVLLGAKKRGYTLVHQTQNQYGPTSMVFEKN